MFGIIHTGANTDPNFRPQLTSYDYDAPLAEAADVTPKYFAMRDVIKSVSTTVVYKNFNF